MRNSRFLLFDHIPRTGGTYFASILPTLIGSTSENLDCGPDYPITHSEEIRKLDRYRVIVGHMRLDTVKAFRKIRPRNLISIIREPVALIESTYTFWRYNVNENLPHVNLAKTLEFSEFIRRPDLNMLVDNPITRHLFGLWKLEKIDSTETTKVMAVQMAESYAFMGVTERMDESVRAFTYQFAPRKVRTIRGDIHRNESLGTTLVKEEDREYLRKQTQVDAAIYQHVNQKLDQILAQADATKRGRHLGLLELAGRTSTR